MACSKFIILWSLYFVSTSLGHEGHGPKNPNSVPSQHEWNDAHHLSLKVNQGVDLKWLSKDDSWLTMEMSSFCKGYVSVGFCTKWKGTMEGCDIVLGWVDNHNGTAHLYDYYARGNRLPELDNVQNYQLLEGTQEMGITTIRFRRKWNTGDDFYDADLEHNEVRVIWAWHPEDPFSADSFFKHAGSSRGHMSQDVSFKNPKSNEHYHEQLSASSGESMMANSMKIPMWSNIICALGLFAMYAVAHM